MSRGSTDAPRREADLTYHLAHRSAVRSRRLLERLKGTPDYSDERWRQVHWSIAQRRRCQTPGEVLTLHNHRAAKQRMQQSAKADEEVTGTRLTADPRHWRGRNRWGGEGEGEAGGTTVSASSPPNSHFDFTHPHRSPLQHHQSQHQHRTEGFAARYEEGHHG